MSKRKPHNHIAGYVAERKCSAGGHIVIYDRQKGFEIDADHRWIVMHEPSSVHVSVTSLKHARALMKQLADGQKGAWDWTGTGTALDRSDGEYGPANQSSEFIRQDLIYHIPGTDYVAVIEPTNPTKLHVRAEAEGDNLFSLTVPDSHIPAGPVLPVAIHAFNAGLAYGAKQRQP